MQDVKRILVIARSTKHCHRTIHMAISLAKGFDAKLYVLHVVHDPFGLEGWNLPVPSFKHELENLMEKTKEELHEIIVKEREKGMPIEELVKNGEPYREIINIIESEEIDLLIMSSHQEGRLEHFLFGKTNDRIILDMPCSIMLVKSKFC